MSRERYEILRLKMNIAIVKSNAIHALLFELKRQAYTSLAKEVFNEEDFKEEHKDLYAELEEASSAIKAIDTEEFKAAMCRYSLTRR